MSTNVTADLIRALIEHMRGAGDDWESFAMVIEFRGEQLAGTHGYAYSPGGAVSPVASRPTGIKPALDAYTESYYKPGEALPVAILVQFDRVKGEYEVTFEDTDATRWQVTPENIATIAEQLRPKLD
ncbi:hypothetical protein [Microbacterium immunditiarum]|uniref:Uncharacterized protein n=1 Tax=Microbacterium immunditiarum TaxID=337480 RepID=A0A7Y9GR76_9MICO|nr:hypothetical protein [Microbacterium immunditiarum]NYE21210.1 hypothetical protein [Microbacterium immunditiarum]